MNLTLIQQKHKQEVLRKIISRFTTNGLLQRFHFFKEKYGTVNPNIEVGNIVFVTQWREGKIAKNELLAMEDIFKVFHPKFIEKHWNRIIEECLLFNK